METPLKIQFPALVIDGSGSGLFAGVLNAHGKWQARSTQTGAPLEQLFPTVEATLNDANLTLPEIKSYLYCEGPGSVLGLRLCAMAIETWSRLYPESAHLFAYNTLQLCAKLLRLDHSLPAKTLLVSDWKKGAWNAVEIVDGETSATTVVDDDAIANWDGAVYHLPQRKGWQKPPANAKSILYTPDRLPELIENTAWLRRTSEVELYSSGINTFAKWTPDRHRAS
jgi:tRNA threonylcarbamoyladenosine biosynthesis protein TsaB